MALSVSTTDWWVHIIAIILIISFPAFPNYLKKESPLLSLVPAIIGLILGQVLLLYAVSRHSLFHIATYSLFILATATLLKRPKWLSAYLLLSALALMAAFIFSEREFLSWLRPWAVHVLVSTVWARALRKGMPQKQFNMDNVDYAFMMKNLEEGVMFVDHQGVCLKTNNKWNEITGYSEEELIGVDVAALLLYEQDILFMREQSERRKEGEFTRYEVRIKTKSQRDKWVMTIGMPLFNKQGDIIGSLGIMTDLTESITMKNQLQQHSEELEASNKHLQRANEDLSKVASVLSHDLRSPIRTAKSFAQLLSKRYGGKLDKGAKEYIGFIEDGCDNMLEIVEGILALAKHGTDAMERSWHSVGEVMGIIFLNLDEKIRSNEANVSLVNPTGVALYCDKVQILQLFQNLVENAIKYAKPGVPSDVRIEAKDYPDHTSISITDNGLGIHEDDQKDIFLLFGQVDKQSEGLGLGLATCKKIVDNHQGSIQLKSVFGEGSTFTIILPKPRNNSPSLPTQPKAV